MSGSYRFTQGQWTAERREIADLAWEALRAYPKSEVVRFVLPLPPPVYTLEPIVEPASSFHLNTATVTRERLRLRFNGPWSMPDRLLVARIHDPRNDDTFYVSDSGDVFEAEK